MSNGKRCNCFGVPWNNNSHDGISAGVGQCWTGQEPALEQSAPKAASHFLLSHKLPGGPWTQIPKCTLSSNSCGFQQELGTLLPLRI